MSVDLLEVLTVATPLLRPAAVVPGAVLGRLAVPVVDVRVELAASVQTSLPVDCVLSGLGVSPELAPRSIAREVAHWGLLN